jgi:hypothetical protein
LEFFPARLANPIKDQITFLNIVIREVDHRCMIIGQAFHMPAEIALEMNMIVMMLFFCTIFSAKSIGGHSTIIGNPVQ